MHTHSAERVTTARLPCCTTRWRRRNFGEVKNPRSQPEKVRVRKRKMRSDRHQHGGQGGPIARLEDRVAKPLQRILSNPKFAPRGGSWGVAAAVADLPREKPLLALSHPPRLRLLSSPNLLNQKLGLDLRYKEGVVGLLSLHLKPQGQILIATKFAHS